MRLRKLSLFWALLLLFPHFADAHGESPLAVIVDTDMALDDVRALGLLIQSPDVHVIAVVTSDGASAPGPGAQNVRNILRALGQGSVRVAPGLSLDRSPPSWREMSESLGWSEIALTEDEKESNPGQKEEIIHGTAKDLIQRTLRENETGVIYICLGPMTNLAEALLADPSLGKRIKAVYYSGSAPEVVPPSWNTARDISAARFVFDNPVPVFSFQVVDENLLTFDQNFLDAVCGFETPTAELMCDIHGHRRVRSLVQSEHFRCWDEMVVLAVLYPEICLDRPSIDRFDTAGMTRFDRTAAYFRYLNLLSGETAAGSGHRKPVVLTEYPNDPEMFHDDVRSVAIEIIERHGLEEWNCALLANEFHRHLGIYSLVGVKMGIRAREILDAGIDELQVISESGSRPPLSCLCDGLQVATGASLGRGAISVDQDKSEPAAVFVMGNTRLRLRLKHEISVRIKGDIEEAVRNHGAMTPEYWLAVRELSLRYWLEMNRREIFDEVFSGTAGRGQAVE